MVGSVRPVADRSKVFQLTLTGDCHREFARAVVSENFTHSVAGKLIAGTALLAHVYAAVIGGGAERDRKGRRHIRYRVISVMSRRNTRRVFDFHAANPLISSPL